MIIGRIFSQAPRAGSGGSLEPDFTETPTGVIDGVNTVFTLTHKPQAHSLKVYINGGYMSEGVDYTLSEKTLTFNDPILIGEIVKATYEYS